MLRRERAQPLLEGGRRCLSAVGAWTEPLPTMHPSYHQMLLRVCSILTDEQFAHIGSWQFGSFDQVHDVPERPRCRFADAQQDELWSRPPHPSVATLTPHGRRHLTFFFTDAGPSHRMASLRAKPSRRMRSTASSRVKVPLPPSRARRYRSTISSSSARTLSYEDAMEEIWSGIAQRQIARPRRRYAHRHRRGNWSSSETLSGAASLCVRAALRRLSRPRPARRRSRSRSSAW